VACLLGSCGWHVFENGRRIPRPCIPRPCVALSLGAAGRDSILTVSLSNTVSIPDSAIVISHVIIKGPLQRFADYDRFVAYARDEAARVGGNMMKIDQFHGMIHTKWIRQGIYTTVYRMKEPDLARFSRQLDSAKKHYADSIGSMAIVHIRDRDEQGQREVYFNDSIVAKIRGVGFDAVRNPGRSDLVFREKGVLNVEPGPPSHLDIELGKEYFILLYTVTSRHGYGYYYQLMDKEHFYYKLW
jgi:hypothetical protein